MLIYERLSAVLEMCPARYHAARRERRIRLRRVRSSVKGGGAFGDLATGALKGAQIGFKAITDPVGAIKDLGTSIIDVFAGRDRAREEADKRRQEEIRRAREYYTAFRQAMAQAILERRQMGANLGTGNTINRLFERVKELEKEGPQTAGERRELMRQRADLIEQRNSVVNGPMMVGKYYLRNGNEPDFVPQVGGPDGRFERTPSHIDGIELPSVLGQQPLYRFDPFR